MKKKQIVAKNHHKYNDLESKAIQIVVSMREQFVPTIVCMSKIKDHHSLVTFCSKAELSIVPTQNIVSPFSSKRKTKQ